MKKVDVSEYLHPDEHQADTAQNGSTERLKRDITYSSLLGYGFRPRVKPQGEVPDTKTERR